MKATADYPTNSTSKLPADSYSFNYAIGVTLWLTRADIDLLILCSKHHYDSRCQELGLAIGESPSGKAWKASRNGALAILRDAYLAADGERTPASLTQWEIDTMLKILEVVDILRSVPSGAAIDGLHVESLLSRLREAFHGINREYYRLRSVATDQPFAALA